MIHHGYDRLTRDIDIWIATDAANAQRVSAALEEFGFAPANVPPETFARPGALFRIGRSTTVIELLTKPTGVDFEQCWSERQITEINGLPVNVISLHHLRQNKKAAGRLKDLADLEELPPAPGAP